MGRCIFAWQAECLACVLFQTENHGRTVIRQFLSFCRHSRVARAAIASYVHVCSHRCHCLSCGSRFVPVVWLSSQAQYFRNVVCLWNWINLLFLGVIAVQFNSPPFNASILSCWWRLKGFAVTWSLSSSLHISVHVTTSIHIAQPHLITELYIESGDITSYRSRPITSHHIILCKSSHHITSHHFASHHLPSRHITSHQITDHHMTWHRMTWHYITWYHMTWHHITSFHFSPVTNHITSPHTTSQTTTFLHVTSQTWHHTTPHHSTSHDHHRHTRGTTTAEGW